MLPDHYKETLRLYQSPEWYNRVSQVPWRWSSPLREADEDDTMVGTPFHLLYFQLLPEPCSYFQLVPGPFTAE